MAKPATIPPRVTLNSRILPSEELRLRPGYLLLFRPGSGDSLHFV